MKPVKIILIAALLMAVMGAESYEFHQAAQLRDRLESIRQQQAPWREQIIALQQENEDASNEAVRLAEENEQLKSNQAPAELAALRDEVKRLKDIETQKENNPAEVIVNTWINQVTQFKLYATQHPEECVPEFQFLTDREWLIVVHSDRPNDFGFALQELKSQASSRFAGIVSAALKKYAAAHNGQFPRELAQLKPYCSAEVEDILQQRYEIRPASVLAADTINDLKTLQNVKTDWVIAGKETESKLTGNHLAIFADGYSYYW